jgi:hypothetical protein
MAAYCGFFCGDLATLAGRFTLAALASAGCLALAWRVWRVIQKGWQYLSEVQKIQRQALHTAGSFLSTPMAGDRARQGLLAVPAVLAPA